MSNLWKLDNGFLAFVIISGSFRRLDLKVLMRLVDLKSILNKIIINNHIWNIYLHIFIYQYHFWMFINEKTKNLRF